MKVRANVWYNEMVEASLAEVEIQYPELVVSTTTDSSTIVAEDDSNAISFEITETGARNEYWVNYSGE